MIRQISRRNQVTLPQKLLASLGAKALDYVRIERKGKVIVLVPVSLEGKMDDEDWTKLKTYLRKEGRGARYVSAKEAKKQIDSL